MPLETGEVNVSKRSDLRSEENCMIWESVARVLSSVANNLSHPLLCSQGKYPSKLPETQS